MYGFESYNGQGYMQVSSSDVVITYAHKQTVNYDNSYYTVNDNALYACRPANNASISPIHNLQSNFGKGWLYNFVITPRPTATHNMGLEVFNAETDLIYSSNYQPLRIVERVSLKNVNNMPSTHWSKADDGKLAIIFTHLPHYRNANNTTLKGVAVVRKNGSISIQRSDILYDPMQVQYLPQFFDLEFLVIDITGY